MQLGFDRPPAADLLEHGSSSFTRCVRQGPDSTPAWSDGLIWSGVSEAAPKPRYEPSIATAFCGLQRRLLVPANPIRVGPTLQEIGGRRLLRAAAGVPEGTRNLVARWHRNPYVNCRARRGGLGPRGRAPSPSSRARGSD